MVTIKNYSQYLRDHYTDTSSPKDRKLLISEQADLAIHYSPFEFVNPAAKVCVIGITPGATQAHLANTKTAELLRAGHSEHEAIRIAKSHASFGGAMRNNLVSMLDTIGLNRRLGLESCSEVFDTSNLLANFTSSLMYPVFRYEKDYNGSPCPTKNTYLKKQVIEHLEYQCDLLPCNVMWLPLGPVPTKVLHMVCELGLISSNQVLDGLPHPSGANAERIAVFTGRKDPSRASSKTNSTKLLTAREALIKKVAA